MLNLPHLEFTLAYNCKQTKMKEKGNWTWVEITCKCKRKKEVIMKIKYREQTYSNNVQVRSTSYKN